MAGEYPYNQELPLYILILFIPLVAIPDVVTAIFTFFFPALVVVPDADWFAIIRAIWTLILEIAIIVSVYFSIDLTDRRPGRVFLIGFYLFPLVWFYSLKALQDGDVVILTTMLYMVILWGLRTGKDQLVGVLLALITIEWEIGLPFLVFLLVWILAHRRWTVFITLILTLFVLNVIASFIYPQWFGQFIRSVVSSGRSSSEISVLRVLSSIWPALPEKAGWVLVSVMFVLVYLEWWAARYLDFRRFYWVACLTLAATPLMGLSVDLNAYVVMGPPVILLLMVIQDRWPVTGAWLNIFFLLSLSAGSWVCYWQFVEAREISLAVVMYLPVPLFLIIGLYWVRWWALQPPRTWLDQVTTAGLQ
ncbi:MAG: hypothetical protein JXA13_00525 [Anaerolineales bacterium]|nr:hypothetical protein [Anaerolineales bacterium]